MDLWEIEARLEIQQRLCDYAYGVDRSDWERYKSVFTPDADLDYTRSLPLRGTPEQIVAVFKPSFETIPWAQHYITDISYEFVSNERCNVTAMFYNPCQLPMVDKVSHFYGYYEHVFVKTADGWKSEHLVEYMMQQINPPSPEDAEARMAELSAAK